MRHHLNMHLVLTLLAVIISTIIPVKAQILWEISNNEAKKPSYILGTHHIAPISILDSISGFKEAFNSCQQLYGELDMESATQKIITDSQQYMVAPTDSTLSKIFTADELTLLDSATQKYIQLPAAQFDIFKPAMLSTQIAIMQAMSIFKDFDPTKQIDTFLQQMAKEKGMEVKGFETADYQLQLVFGTPISYQAQDLMKMLKDETAYMEYSQMLANLYSRQDIDGLFELMNDPRLGITKYEAETQIYRRNMTWMEQLKDILPEGGTFIVVGAGHLPGENGLLALLRKIGYNTTPVK